MMIDISFIMDIFVQFNTGFYRKGNIIYSRKEVCWNYILTWFFIDLVASFPYNYLIVEEVDAAESSLNKAPQLLRLAKMARFLRFLRLLRVFKLKQYLYRLEEMIMNDSLMALLNITRVILVVMFIGHWIACFFFMIGSLESKEKRNCWITEANIHDAQTDEQYISSLYWAFATMTTVGYGDITPITNLEKLFTMLSQLASCAVFAYVVGSIETIVKNSNSIDSEYK